MSERWDYPSEEEKSEKVIKPSDFIGGEREESMNAESSVVLKQEETSLQNR